MSNNNSQWNNNSFRSSGLNNSNSNSSSFFNNFKSLPVQSKLPPVVSHTPNFLSHPQNIVHSNNNNNYDDIFSKSVNNNGNIINNNHTHQQQQQHLHNMQLALNSNNNGYNGNNNSFFVTPRSSNNYSNLNGGDDSPVDDFPPIGVFDCGLFIDKTAEKVQKSLSLYDRGSSNGGSFKNNNIHFGNFNATPSHFIDANGSGVNRETGIIEKLLHSYGFIQSCERQARLFFHFSQFAGNIEHLKVGDAVEFEMSYDRRTGKPVASNVSKIAPDVALNEERVMGTVTTDLAGTENNGDTGDGQARITYEHKGECFFLPFNKDDVEGNVTLRIGDEVSFQMATNNRGNLSAVHIRLENSIHPVKYQGVICSLKEKSGFIERADVVKEIHFRSDDVISSVPLTLGDDVEFNIRTKNGKEMAYNVEKLPDGTVVFEDISEDIVKGQVLKTYERGDTNDNGEPSPGKIKYRAADHSEVEVSYGQRDQKGGFTLRHGDWVEFRVAVDRRDQMKRATCISLLADSFTVSGEKREQGIIAFVDDKEGRVQPAERQIDISFDLEEIIDITKRPVVGDEVEFTVILDPSYTFGNNHQLTAIRMRYLQPGTVQFESLIETNVLGTLIRFPTEPSPVEKARLAIQDDNAIIEPGCINFEWEGQMLSAIFGKENCEFTKYFRVDSKVRFDLYQIKRNKQYVAKNVERVISKNMTHGRREQYYNIRKEREFKRTVYQGYIATLKDAYGFIETINFERELFFHFSQCDGNPNTIDVGTEVEFTINLKTTGTHSKSAENVHILPKGTIQPKGMVEPNTPVLKGVVKRSVRLLDPDQAEYCGLIQEISATEATNKTQEQKPALYEFGIISLKNKKDMLQKGDNVLFQVDSANRAANIVSTREKLQSTIDSLKGEFGFLSYQVNESNTSSIKKKLFFHMSQVRDTDQPNLKVGDTVEFVLVSNPRTGKSAACDVVKICDGHNKPEHLINRGKRGLEEGPKTVIIRHPRGPDVNSRGFAPRKPRDIKNPRLNL